MNYQWTSQRHTPPAQRRCSNRPAADRFLHLHTVTKWSSCARRTGGPPSLLLWLWALRAAASLPCCGLQTSKTWIRSARRGSRRRASVTSPRPSPVHARGRSNKRISVCASATICGCTVGGDDDGNASTRPLYLRWPRGPPRRRHFVRRPRPARRRRAGGRRRARASRTRQGDHHSPRASRTQLRCRYLPKRSRSARSRQSRRHRRRRP